MIIRLRQKIQHGDGPHAGGLKGGIQNEIHVVGVGGNQRKVDPADFGAQQAQGQVGEPLAVTEKVAVEPLQTAVADGCPEMDGTGVTVIVPVALALPHPPDVGMV